MPRSGPPGTRIILSGSCLYIHYHRPVRVYFDRTLAAAFDGTGPQYATEIVVPRRAEPGIHTLTMDSPAGISFGSIVASFEVTGEPLPCSGDCNLDNAVDVGELVTGVNITLGARMPESCPPFDVDANDEVAVNELVLAVDAAMRGCDPEPGCHDFHECENGAQCLSPGVSRGCGFCRSFENTCASGIECADDEICEPVPAQECPCEAVNICQPRCTVDSCGENEECRASGRCGPLRCAPEPCPAHFQCVPLEGLGMSCIRRACIFDGDCLPGGACVNGQCHESLGTCTLPVP